MAWRALLWILVVIAPGGVLLLPILAADALKRRAALGALTAPASERPSLVLERRSLIDLAGTQVG
ncbi:MAG TPA: hypothetical protein VG937_22910 [Polyangiaceae bacterium]|nr:hypothetical protein [Polyangiaceae bacterium]